MSYNPESMKVTSGRDGSYKASDVKGRPTSDLKEHKDFKKVLEKNPDNDNENIAAEEIIEETDGITLAMAEDTKKKQPFSLFDLTATKKSPPFEGKLAKSEQVVVPTSDIGAKKIASNIPTKEQHSLDDSLEEAEVAVMSDKIDKADKTIPLPSTDKDKFTTRFSTEQADLSYINPLAATANQQPSINLSISTEKAIIPVSNIQEIINQMIAKATEMKHSGTTETVLTLKYPPLFEGATIVVTSFDSAKNEFNISIENLTQVAKNLMDMKVNKDSLLLALEQKGYAVHILATTTVQENRVVDSLPQEDRSGRQRGQEREGSRQQQGREEEA